jgi:hypothetical protein
MAKETDLMLHKERAEALDRALKMGVLFKLDNFKNIMDAVYLNEVEKKEATKQVATPKARKAKRHFKNACKKAGLDPKQTDWLWNYLENYKEKLDWACPGAGW